MDLIADLALVLLATTTGGYLAQRLRQPLIVGYIVGIARAVLHESRARLMAFVARWNSRELFFCRRSRSPSG